MADKAQSTVRSRLLLRALDCINANDYDDRGNYIIFGKDLDEIMDEAGIPESEIKGDSDRPHLRTLASDVKVWSGREHAARRTSLSKPNRPNEVRGLDKLSSEGVRSILDSVTAPQPTESLTIRPERAPDDLDAHFAHELLRKLPKIVSRVSALDELELDDRRQIPREDVKRYFEEAHRCYLYGFPIACAVLCRAILESALKEIIDPDRRIERTVMAEARKLGNQKESNIGRLVDEAAKRNILTDDRPECAIKVRDAGNDAIHNHGKFQELLGDPLRGIAYILDSTRKILIDLYSVGS